MTLELQEQILVLFQLCYWSTYLIQFLACIMKFFVKNCVFQRFALLVKLLIFSQFLLLLLKLIQSLVQVLYNLNNLLSLVTWSSKTLATQHWYSRSISFITCQCPAWFLNFLDASPHKHVSLQFPSADQAVLNPSLMSMMLSARENEETIRHEQETA